MGQTIKNLFLIFVATLILSDCKDNKQKEKMTWSTMKSEHEGFPLYLRKPNYTNIYEFKDRFPLLLRVAQILEKVKDNGLPEGDYNLSLMDFDESMTELFDEEKEGVVFLVETFGGERGYYYFISDTVDYIKRIKKIKEKYKNVTLDTSTKIDTDWGFLEKYPTKLY